MADLWNAYIDKFETEPSNPTRLLKFSKSDNYSTISFKNASVLFNTYKGKGKIINNNNKYEAKENHSNQPIKHSLINKIQEIDNVEGADNDEKNDNVEDNQGDEGERHTGEVHEEKEPHTEKLISVLLHYNKTMNQHIIDKQLMNRINIVDAVNDFQHLLPQQNINKQIDIIKNNLKHCEISKCIMFKRNYRDRSAFRDNKEIAELYAQKDSLIAKIDTALGHHYKQYDMDYFDEDNIGKFKKFCDGTTFDDNTIRNELNSDSEQSIILHFDEHFPLDESINDMNQKRKKILEILKDIIEPTNEEQIDSKYIARCEMLDKIHCFSQHSMDIGNILSAKEEHIIEQDGEENAKLINEQEVVNERWIKLKIILSQKKNTNMLTTLKQRMLRKYNQNMLISGWEFKYDIVAQEDEEKKIIDEQHTNDVIVIYPKYRNLKEELTCNSISTISQIQFHTELEKAQIHWDTDYRKEFHKPLLVKHVFALMIYCNFDELQHKFSNTYRIKQCLQHSNFYHWGKILKQAVLEFGISIRKRKVKVFYHGIRELLVPPNIVGYLGKGIKIYCPLSTSSSMEVAANFTNNSKGLIMQFGGIRSRAKCFSVSWLSDYANEDEYLFLQNKDEFQVNNIIECKTGYEYKHILNGLKKMDAMLSIDYYENDSTISVNNKMIPFILKMIDKQRNKFNKLEVKNN
eukprot:521676_1